MTAHATLGASASFTWMNCPGAIRVAAGVPEAKTEEAQEGTNAHAQAEHVLKGKDPAKGPHPDLMADLVPYFSLIDSLVGLNSIVKIEETVQFDEWVPGGFGTADAIIIDEDQRMLTIVDLKFGKGIRVDAQDNSQLRLYGLGCLQKYQFLYGIETIRMIVCQPRLDHEDEETLSVDDLLAWGDNVVRPKALATLEPDAPVVPGLVQCQWCRARFVCRKRAISILDVMGSDTLTPANIGMLFPHTMLAVKWADDVAAYAGMLMAAGVQLHGLKLVEGRARRKMRDDAATTLAQAGLTHDQIYRQEYRSLGEIEAALGGKKAAKPVMALATLKPVGKPTIVPVSDPRPPISVDVIADFPEGE
jgi:hypothetical protein